jgi:NADPH:quinone reductase-like Zn-dependent oxidoreductase
MTFFVASENGADLAPLTELADAGAYRPAIDRVFDLTSAADAMRRLESGDVRGKVVLSVV